MAKVSSHASVWERAPKPPDERLRWTLTLIIAVLILAWAFVGAQFRPAELVAGVPQIADIVGRMLPPDPSQVVDVRAYSVPHELSWPQLILPLPLSPELSELRSRWWSNTFPQTVIGATIQTIQMAVAGTFLALLAALPLSFLAARNTTPANWLYSAVRGVLNFLRSIPELAYGLIFVAAVGLGAFAGTLAVAVGTTTVLAKLLSESIERIDQGVVEAIRATGGNYLQTLSFAVIPQLIPDLISFTLYRFESNIRAASVLGLIGAGGIGYLLNTAFRQFQYQQAAAIMVVLVVLVMSVDFLSAQVRKSVI